MAIALVGPLEKRCGRGQQLWSYYRLDARLMGMLRW